MNEPLPSGLLAKMHAYWRAANYLSVGQIYLFDNPLLKAPLSIEHVKPRLLGHWGTTPGLNFIYVHLNRIIRQHDLNMMYVIGPGHGGPGIVAQQADQAAVGVVEIVQNVTYGWHFWQHIGCLRHLVVFFLAAFMNTLATARSARS